MKTYKFDIRKGNFEDGIALRFGWDPVKFLSTWACKVFKVAHAPLCPKCGYKNIRHNGMRDPFANLLNEFCDDVKVEPCTSDFAKRKLRK